MNILSIAWRYKELIIIGLLLASTLIFKTLWKNAKDDLAEYKLKQQILYDNAVRENEKIKIQSVREINSIMANHQQQLKDLNLDRVHETNKLKGSINEISDSLTIAYDAISLRNQATGHSALSKVSETARESAEACGNVYQSLITVTEACKIVDLDYKALYNAWDRACLIYGCE